MDLLTICKSNLKLVAVMLTQSATTVTSLATSHGSVAAEDGRDRQETVVATTLVNARQGGSVGMTTDTGDLLSVAISTEEEEIAMTTDATLVDAMKDGRAVVTASKETLATVPAVIEETTAWNAAEVLLRTEAGTC